MKHSIIKLSIPLLFFCLISEKVQGQESVKVSLEEFIKRGLEESGESDYDRQEVRLAENRTNQARAQRYLPTFELTTQHGTVPGIKSNRQDLDEDEYYLDPNLENDWRDWAVFSRAEVNAIQPVFTWGALSSAVKAAQAGAEAARQEFETKESERELQLFELYQSHLLSTELNRLLDDANDQLGQVEEQLEERREEGSEDLDDSDVFKFEVFKSEFAMQAAEVEENTHFIQNTWDFILKADENTNYEPEESFLDPVESELQELDHYKTLALENRSELKGIDAGIEAAEHGVKATRAQNYPSFFIGMTGSYANTPNRPRQSNPFIRNNTNYASIGIGFGIRQNLDFFSARTEIQRNEIQHRQTQFLKDAAVEGIVIELNEAYKEASLSQTRMEQADEALTTSKKWVRQEQLDYDMDMGDTKDLLDAIQKELELRVQLIQLTFEFNKDMSELYKAAGIPVTSLNPEN